MASSRQTPRSFITASEVAQYVYCPLSWYLGRDSPSRSVFHRLAEILFPIPRSRKKEAGIQAHRQMAGGLANIRGMEVGSRLVMLVGIILILSGILLFMATGW